MTLRYKVSPELENHELNDLFGRVWENHTWVDYEPVLGHSLAYVCAYEGERLIGFVNLAWDGGEHGFILDTVVDRDRRLRGIGQQLVLRAVAEAERRGLKWVHVDFEPQLQHFYKLCGFRHTTAGLKRLR